MDELLTEQQRKYGQRKYLFFASFNGLSVALVAEGTLILYALKFGIPDYIVALMSSFFFLGMPCIVLGKRLTSKIGVSKAVSLAWFLRYVSIFAAILAPLIVYYTTSFSLGVASVLIGSFGFYAFRGVGSIGWNPLLGELTTKEDRGKYSSNLFLWFNIMYFLGILSLVILFEYWDTIGTFQVVLSLGCVFGFISAFNVLQVPETSNPRKSAAESIKEAIIFLLDYPKGRKLMLVNIIYFVGIALTVPYSILALKEGYEIRDYKAMLFILDQLLGAIIFFIVVKKMIGKIKISKILYGLFSFMIIASVMWSVAPENFYWWYCGIIFFILGAAQMGGFLMLITYFLGIIPPLKRVGSTLVITFVSTLCAGAFAAIVGAGILKILGDVTYDFLSEFHFFFMIVFLFLVSGMLLMYYYPVPIIKRVARRRR